VDYVLYEVPATLLADPARDFRALAQGADTTGLVRAGHWTRPTADGPAWTWREEQMTLPGAMPPGAYLLAGRAGGLERRALLFVTDLSLLVKRSATRVLVSAAALKSGRPVAGATVVVVAAPVGAPPGQGWSAALGVAGGARAVTDARGLASVPLTGETRRVRVVGVSDSNGLSVAEAPLAPAAERGGDQLFLYTDRPIYRPGQTVHWKAFARRAAEGGYVLPAPGPLGVTLTGPEGASLEVPPGARLSARGSADGTIQLPDDLTLGDWTLAATAGRAAGSAVFAVQAYRKPEFQAEVTPDREVYVNGDEVRFRVAASYFFGAPVFGAVVRYNLFESRLRTEDESWDEEGGEAGSGYGRVLASGESRTDLDGRVALAFVPPRAAYDRRLTLEVEVADAAGRQVSARHGVVMGRGLFAVAVKPLSRIAGTGDAIGVQLTTKDHTGRAVSAPVRVTLDQDAWNPLERRYTPATRPLAEVSLTTDSTGQAFASLRPAPARAGRLEIRARAEDARGDLITAETSVWVWDAQVAEYAYRYPALEAFADRERYQAGDTARILVNTDVRDATVLAALEGRDVEAVQVLALAGNTGLLRFPMRPEYAPNVFVTLHVRKAGEVRSRTLELDVAADRHDLAITLTPDRGEYGPRQTATVAVRTTDGAGAPVAAELSLAVVDEAIYALRADATPDPHDVFYGRRPDWVSTVVSFPTLYFGGADKGGREEVRTDFRDLAFWEPAVLTGADGRAQVSFAWPDNLTTWRLTSRGATEGTLVGRMVEKVLVTKPLVARLAGPRAFVAGDQGTLVSGVTNRTAAPLTGVEESLEATGPVQLGGKGARRADLPAHGESRGEWPVVVREGPAAADSLPAASFRFRARSKVDGDALETQVPVLPRAVPLRPHGAGVLTAAEADVPVALPADLVRAGSELTLELSPSPAAMALRALDYLSAYPWGCTEQTANAVRSVTDLLAVAQRLGVELPGWKDPDRTLRPALDRLLALQSAEGGWSWWRTGDPDPYLTALALDALARTSLTGHGGAAVDGALQRGVMAEQRLLGGVRSADGEAYALMHLVGLLWLPEAAQHFPGLRERLEDLALGSFGARESLGDAGLAVAALGHLGLERKEEARTLVALLLRRAVTDGAGLHWRSGGDGWFGEETEATAYGLSALLATAPGDARAAEALRWLATRRRGDHWRSTRATAPVAIALGDWLAAHPAEARPDYRLAVSWDGVPLLERAVGATDLFGRGEHLRVPGGRLRPGENHLALRKSGAGSLYWAWEARALVPSPGPPAVPQARLTVAREYLHAERTADRRGRPRWLVSAADPGEGFKVGESVLVRLTLHAPEALDHLMLEDPRPAGFEVDDLVPEGTDHPWDVHGEARDTRAVFFLGRIEAGDTVLEYLVRPEMAGSLVALPASAGAMYDPDLAARSAENVLHVSGR
jgi:hypothetical protein